MAVLRDVMPAFDLLQPSSAADAQKLLDKHGDDAWIMAGGLDSFDWLKDRIKKPKLLVDLSGIDELRGVRTTADGIEIGAMTTLTEIVNNPIIQSQYSVLSQAAELVASPQIRNQGTIGGNVSQDVRCWYYRGGWPCYRAGGNICYADTPVGRNREHAIFGANRCVAVHPSDSVPALIALDAKFVLQTSKGERVVDAEDYFVGPEIDITHINILKPGDLLTAIRIPSTWGSSTRSRSARSNARRLTAWSRQSGESRHNQAPRPQPLRPTAKEPSSRRTTRISPTTEPVRRHPLQVRTGAMPDPPRPPWTPKPRQGRRPDQPRPRRRPIPPPPTRCRALRPRRRPPASIQIRFRWRYRC